MFVRATKPRSSVKRNPAAPSTVRRFATGETEVLKKTPLHSLHVELKAKMTPFAGWDMPLQYTDSIIDSHKHCRAHASLFDVSHMGQLRIEGKNRVKFLERLVVADLASLPVGTAQLSVFTNEKGGIIDDTIIANRGEFLYVVVNAGCFDKDKAHIDAQVSKEKDVKVTYINDRALLALQGPSAEAALAELVPSSSKLHEMKFMTGKEIEVLGAVSYVQRSGYTGEDGFEISVPATKAVEIAKKLLRNPEVRACGLGARDTLRLEAGMCLYGHDLNEEITPKSASLVWLIGKRRKEEGGFLGDKVILPELKGETKQKRVGFVVQGPPAREGATIHAKGSDKQIGTVTSGTFSPSLSKAIGMAYVDTAFTKTDTEIDIKVRDRKYPAKIAKTPFVPTQYKK